MKVLEKGRKQLVKYDSKGGYFTMYGKKEYLSEYIRTNAFKQNSSDYLKVDGIEIHATKGVSNCGGIGINVDCNEYGDQIVQWFLLA